jgi:hypothetical protein
MERGCVEDQPQPVKHAEALENSEGLRLVEEAFVGRVPPRGFRWFLKHALKFG